MIPALFYTCKDHNKIKTREGNVITDLILKVNIIENGQFTQNFRTFFHIVHLKIKYFNSEF